MNKKINDIQFGLCKEDEYFNILKDCFDETLEKTNNKFNLFDYIGKDCYIELKSRRNTHDKYPDTMVGYNKIEFANAANNSKTTVFCFAFTDGLFYYKFDKMDLINKNLRIDIGGRNDRGKEEYKQYCYIPIELLKKV
jgi:hypothetical protein